MRTDTREMILAEARATVQAQGYNRLSFRDLAGAVRIKSASVHYHFPTKADLGVAMVRDYCARARDHLAAVLEETDRLGERLRRYTGLFRKALERDGRMCLCGILAAEIDTLPEELRVEVRAFTALNVAWLAQVLANGTPGGAADHDRRARAILAAILGAQLVARGGSDIALYDEMVETYRSAGLIPA
jgi:TetR/AcrR family transcriptional repressor of nem operon